MPALPWTTPQEPTSDALVMASRLEVRSLRDVPGFFLASMSLHRQARRSDGAWGVALKADLFRRTFWTVSAWRDRAALNAYAAAEPHRSTMRAKRGVMKDSTFVFWTARPGDLPVTWKEVEERVAAEKVATG